MGVYISTHRHFEIIVPAKVTEGVYLTLVVGSRKKKQNIETMSKTLSIENGRIVTVKLSLMLYTIRRLVEERNQVIHRFIIWLAA